MVGAGFGLAVAVIHRRLLGEWLLLLLLLVTFVVAALHGRWLERADIWAYDWAIKLNAEPAAVRGARAPVLVAIDEASLARLGRWPWSREKLAEILDCLSRDQAGPVLLDIILAEPASSLEDARLAQAIRHYPGRVVLPVYGVETGGGAAIQPLPLFRTVAVLGHAEAAVDSDGIVRRIHPSEVIGGMGLPHISWVMAGVAPPHRPEARLIQFSGPSGSYARVSAAALLAGEIPPSTLKGHPVLVGATAVGLGDTVATPLSGRNGEMSGVEFVANVLTAVQTDGLIRPTSLAATLVLSLLLLLGVLIAYLLVPLTMALATTVVVAAGSVLGAVLALKWAGVWWPPATTVLGVCVAYPLWSWRRLEASVTAMARETGRIASLVPASVDVVLPHQTFLDPVESRIQAISVAVDRVAAGIAIEAGPAERKALRDDTLRHLAHDLRAPLISLRGLAEALERSEAGEAEDLVARVDACARRALDLSEQFLLFGRADNIVATDFGEVDLVELLHQVADDLWEDARRHQAAIERDSIAENWWVQGDYRLLSRALLNLGWNALRYGPEGGTLTFFFQRDPAGGVRLGVRDQGRGFDPLEGTSTAKASPIGSYGLGLTFVRKVAERHGAVFAVDQGEDGFSAFLLFPAQPR